MTDEKEQKIGFVPQIVNLLDDTVRRNVAFGVKDQEIDDLVWRELEQAQLKTTIEGYKQGSDTIIGERVYIICFGRVETTLCNCESAVFGYPYTR